MPLDLVGEELWWACSLGVNKGRVLKLGQVQVKVGNYKEGGIGLFLVFC
jgi:hypothetical protein